MASNNKKIPASFSTTNMFVITLVAFILFAVPNILSIVHAQEETGRNNGGGNNDRATICHFPPGNPNNPSILDNQIWNGETGHSNHPSDFIIITQADRDRCSATPPPANNPPVISLIGTNPIILTVGDVFVDPGVNASDPDVGDTVTVTTTTSPAGGVNTSSPSTWTITYVATDSHGLTASVSRTVTVNAVNPPIDLCLNIEGNQVIVPPGMTRDNAGNCYVNTGTGNLRIFVHVINDNGNTKVASDFTVNIFPGNNPNPATFSGNELGTNIVMGVGYYGINLGDHVGYTYSPSGSCASLMNDGDNKVCTVTLDDIGNGGGGDNNPPTIHLVGTNPIILTVGNTFVDPGVITSDPDAGDVVTVSSSTVPTGPINTSVAGIWTITYVATDSHGATASVTRVLQVNPVDGNTYGPVTVLPWLGPQVVTIRTGSNLNYVLNWSGGPLNKDWQIFVHYVRNDGHEFNLGGDFWPSLPTSQWGQNSIVTSNSLFFPADIATGTYKVMVGLYRGQDRFTNLHAGPINPGSTTLIPKDGQYRFQVGTLVITDPTDDSGNGSNNKPVITFGANPSTIALNATSLLSWSTTGATSCLASGKWSGDKATTSSETVGPFTEIGTHTYVLACTGLGGTSTSTIVVTVNSNGDNSGGTTGGGTSGGGTSGGGTSGGSSFSSGSGSTSSSGSIGSAGYTQFLQSSPQATSSCPLITTYMRLGGSNDGADVARLQSFFKNSELFNIDVTGIFDERTDQATREFQTKYSADILGPWSASIPSGYVYITTSKKINELACKAPIALSASDLAIIDAYKLRRLASLDNTVQNNLPTDNADITVPDAINATSTEEIGSAEQPENTNVAAVGSSSILSRFWNFIKSIFK